MQEKSWLKSLIDLFQSDIWKNKFAIVVFSLALLTNLGVWIFLYFKLVPSEYPIPIHYNIYTGIDVVDYWYKVYTIPTLGLFLIILNFMLSIVFYAKDRLIAYMLGFGALTTQLILFVGCIMIIYGL